VRPPSDQPLIHQKRRKWVGIALLAALAIILFNFNRRDENRRTPINFVPPTAVQVAKSTQSPNLDPPPPPPPAASPTAPMIAAAAAPSQPLRIIPERYQTSVPPPAAGAEGAGPGPGPGGIDFGERLGPENVSDGRKDTAWVLPDDATGESVTLDFDGNYAISAIQVLPGIDRVDPRSGKNIFPLTRHLRRVRFEFSDGSTVETTFEDRPELQTVTIPSVVASAVKMVILETSAPAGPARGDFTPIGEIVVLGLGQ
jgi:hypothetical protein